MKRIPISSIIVALILCVTATIALADTATVTSTIAPPIPNTEDLPGVLALMAQAFRGGDYALAGGLILTALVMLIRVFGLTKLVPPEWDKYVAGTIAAATAISIGLQAHMDAWTIIRTGVEVWMVGVGGWEVIGKLIRKLVDKIRGKKAVEPPPVIP